MIYVFDPDEPGERRNWAQFLSQEPVFTDAITSDEYGDGLVFAHGSYLNEERVSAFVLRNPRAFLVAVSAGPPPAWWSDTERAYWRKSPVSKPSDAGFEECAQRFLAEASKGLYSVQLLEPVNAEELWALHVLCEAWLMSEAGKSPDLIQKPSDWGAPFDTQTSPSGLFDTNGTAYYHKFLKLRQTEGSQPATAEEVKDCLDSVIKELVNLGQMSPANPA
jgi:hypothetical protein